MPRTFVKNVLVFLYKTSQREVTHNLDTVNNSPLAVGDAALIYLKICSKHLFPPRWHQW